MKPRLRYVAVWVIVQNIALVTLVAAFVDLPLLNGVVVGAGTGLLFTASLYTLVRCGLTRREW